jgi:two-component system OmpR family response regulator
MSRTIAIVEDEEAIRNNYIEALVRYGYQVQAYSNRQDAEQAFMQQLPDLVLLDIGLDEDIDGGFELCQRLRQQSTRLPIIFLTARDSDLDTVSGFRLGADDYLTKDISLPHLMARISALFRRIETLSDTSPGDDNLIQQGALTLDLDRYEVTWQQQRIDCSLTEFWILHALAKRPGHVKNRDQIMQEANIVVDDSTITSHIKRIRKKFESADADFGCIDTVYGMGYRWKTD